MQSHCLLAPPWWGGSLFIRTTETSLLDWLSAVLVHSVMLVQRLPAAETLGSGPGAWAVLVVAWARRSRHQGHTSYQSEAGAPTGRYFPVLAAGLGLVLRSAMEGG